MKKRALSYIEERDTSLVCNSNSIGRKIKTWARVNIGTPGHDEFFVNIKRLAQAELSAVVNFEGQTLIRTVERCSSCFFVE